MGAGPHGRSSRLQDCKVAIPLELDRFFLLRCTSPDLAVRPEGANHQ